ncbi:arginine permease [Coniochaeta sp. 2T2.1]|nr:arginine permease [Coniochaeta sp. 2T2.1]
MDGTGPIQVATATPGTSLDAEKPSHERPPSAELQRSMSSRHLQFIAIGGTVGTGIFLGTGSALSTAGPVSCLISYIFVGSILYSVMVSLCEMATYIPTTGSFAAYAGRFVDPALGFATGWLYWFSWSMTFALELCAAGLVIQYWVKSLNIGIFIAIFWAVFTALNFLPVRIFGELEMWFASIKVVTIVGFLIFGICINAGAGQQGYIGFSNWTNPPGPFLEYLTPGASGKFVGFWAVLIKAAFSYQGAELVGVGAGEVRNPRKSVPSAIRQTFFGIFTLFTLTIFFIGLLVPSDNKDLLSDKSDASASPLVIAANLAGVSVLPHIINAVLLTAVLSAANSNVYSGSRILVALANEGQAPAFFKRTTAQGVPYIALGCTSAFGLLAFLNLSTQGGQAFDWLLNITAVAGLITWSNISLCHIMFMRAMAAQNIPRSTLPYLAPLQPYLAYYGLIFNVLITLTQGFTVFIEWDVTDFFINYISLLLFAVLYVGHKLVFRSGIVDPKEADLARGCYLDIL